MSQYPCYARTCIIDEHVNLPVCLDHILCKCMEVVQGGVDVQLVYICAPFFQIREF